MEISSGSCRSSIEEVKNIERGFLRELHILRGEELFLHLFPEVMPGQKEGLVTGEVCYFEPLMDTNLAPASGTDGIRHKIAEGTVFIDPSEGIEPAEARPEGVNAAAAVGTEKGTGVCLLIHKEVREDQPAVNVKPDARIQELSEACAEVLAEQTDIIGVQMNCVVHTAAAFAAAFAGAAGYAGKIMGSEAGRHIIFLHRQFCFACCGDLSDGPVRYHNTGRPANTTCEQERCADKLSGAWQFYVFYGILDVSENCAFSRKWLLTGLKGGTLCKWIRKTDPIFHGSLLGTS